MCRSVGAGYLPLMHAFGGAQTSLWERPTWSYQIISLTFILQKLQKVWNYIRWNDLIWRIWSSNVHNYYQILGYCVIFDQYVFLKKKVNSDKISNYILMSINSSFDQSHVSVKEKYDVFKYWITSMKDKESTTHASIWKVK